MGHAWADRPPSAFFCLTQSPISWAHYPLQQQQQSSLIPLWPLQPSPSLTLPHSLLQSSPLFKMSFCSCSPDSCSILEPALGPGGWVLEGCPPGQQRGVGMVGEGTGSPGAWAPTHPLPRAEIKAQPPFPASPGVQTSPPLSPQGLQGLMLVWLILSHSLNPAQHPTYILALSCLRSSLRSENLSLSPTPCQGPGP